MTRINCIDPSLLNKKHLVAEYRELPRIFRLVRNAIERGEKPYDKRNPTTYRLGKGHVRFFYNKTRWLVNRQKQLIKECQARNIKVKYTNTDQLLDGIPKEWQGNWKPQCEDMLINVDRINQRGGLREGADI